MSAGSRHFATEPPAAHLRLGFAATADHAELPRAHVDWERRSRISALARSEAYDGHRPRRAESRDTEQARPTGPRPLAPIPFDVESVFSELAGTARAVTLLYPRAGQPGPGDSSIGGPLLWPAGEPWPMCAEPDHYKPLDAPVGPDPVAMVPVVQLYARDVPDLVFPAGTDLLQILWCPLVHEDDQYAANPRLHWRNTALTAADVADGQPPRPHTAEEDYLPRPCTVSPTPAVEYPNWDLPDELSEQLGERFEALQEEPAASTTPGGPRRTPASSTHSGTTWAWETSVACTSSSAACVRTPRTPTATTAEHDPNQ